MKLVVDRIEGNIVVFQDLDTKKMIDIKKSNIGFKVNEGDIIVFKNNKYYKDDNLKNDRIKLIQEKFNKSKNI